MKILISTDGNMWYVRRIYSVTHDMDKDHMIYRCDKPLGKSFRTLAKAVAYIEKNRLAI